MAQQWDNQNPEFNVKKLIPILIGVVSLILVITFWNKITVNLKEGQAGVMFKKIRGGVDKETIYGEGFHFIAPWNEMVAYDVTQQEIAEVLNVLSSNGLEIKEIGRASCRERV